MARNKLVNWLLFILLALVWGSSFILMKKSAEDLTGQQIAAIRILSAGVLFLPLAFFHLRHIPGGKLHLVLLSGVMGNLFPAFLFAIAIEQMDSSLAGILNSLTPLFVVVIGILFFRDRLHNRKIAGVIIGFIGLLLLTLSKGSITFERFTPVLMILVATIMYGVNVNIVSHYLKGIEPMKMTSVSLAFVGIPAAVVAWYQNVFSIALNEPQAHYAIGASVLLGLVGTGIATGLFYVLIKRAGGLFASLVTYAIPFVSIMWGLWAREDITLVQVGCLGVILSGVYLANR
ncbi:MAG TPA: DMT family transporter [Flavisolibacter sp.]